MNKQLHLDLGDFEQYCYLFIGSYTEERVSYYFRFNNGFGAVVEKQPGSPGYDDDLWYCYLIQFIDGTGNNFIYLDEKYDHRLINKAVWLFLQYVQELKED